MKVLVADDEDVARRRLIRMLGDLGGVDVVGEAATGSDVLLLTRSLHPDLLFLDIDMPELEGIAVARRLATSPAPLIVFVTAHEQHAVSAFDLEAVDYLLKPVRSQRLARALERARARRAGRDEALGLAAQPVLLDDAARIVAQVRTSTRLFDARTIPRFWALEKYTAFAADGEEHLVAESLSALELRLEPFGFVRVHRSHLVQRSAIRELRASRGPLDIHLQDGAIVPVSRRMLKRLKRQLGL